MILHNVSVARRLQISIIPVASETDKHQLVTERSKWRGIKKGSVAAIYGLIWRVLVRDPVTEIWTFDTVVEFHLFLGFTCREANGAEADAPDPSEKTRENRTVS